MIIQTKLSNGDKVWIKDPLQKVTIGQVRVSVTDSPGRPGEELFDNYKAQKEFEESYMCVETGIGSGTVFYLGKSCFLTKEEANESS